MNPVQVPARRRAREAALQMLYQAEIGRTSPGDAILTYWPARDPADGLAEEHQEFANALVRGTSARVGEIDGLLGRHAEHWRVPRMAVIDRLILRLATYELVAEPDTPARVILNEALELARTYSGEEAVAFVNGVLDAVRKELNRE
jgi:transcription antitermination protein NusB